MQKDAYIGIGKASIHEDAKDIKEKILGGLLYGVMVIEEDVETMIVAAYYLGRREVTGRSGRGELHLS